MRTGCSFVFSRGLEVVLYKGGTGVSVPWKSIYFPESLIIKELHIPIYLEAPGLHLQYRHFSDNTKTVRVTLFLNIITETQVIYKCFPLSSEMLPF